jgi:hypothetical protein
MKVDDSCIRYVEFDSSKGLVQGFKILKPEKWAGVVFHFCDVKINWNQKTKDKHVPIDFGFTLLEYPGFEESQLKTEEFGEYIEEIFKYVWNEAL